MILSHRGYWLKEKEKNTIKAFERSFSLGFGTETDIRDFNGELVISHDIPTGSPLSVDSFFQIYNSFDNSLPLALNIKSDGLQEALNKIIKKYKIENYFVFDMSIPDTIGYLKKSIKTYARQSEYEQTPSFYNTVNGIWLDEFKTEWITTDIIRSHVANSKNVCIVSPELHKKDYLKRWQDYKCNFNLANNNYINICTDFPVKAKEYFNE